MNKKDKVDFIQNQEIILVLANALNYGEASAPLYLAAMQEILTLRNQVRELGGAIPDVISAGLPGRHSVLYDYDLEKHYTKEK